MLDLKEYQRLKSRVETAKSEADKAQGVYEQAMATLEEEFECKTLKDAEAKLAALDKDAATAETAYDAAKAEFEKEWADVLGELPQED